ncbi:MAG TPA: chromosome partitioning protein ParB [Methylophaga sp.]|jgi:ParB family chromosome partitioning protein|uniref:ParB/RepB/Spo0J family partition protein n=1 Tax=unclassified Methylophaga TaxID=2629249 RepID=UPI000C907BDB|nr:MULTISPECIES: ParB/RepB/Spo0J family partition protein [unclassified Methylophaga]MAP27517.1 chromosome partitioning protein ParB [Methylophaga sp.]HAD30257.1 chromosome partitioning protein ParB [Methylophaga sp.]HBX60283.1 chromosome partitioning protein ParB [Methylophaga sp.]HCO00904.1 chromosome partitioning protein ParB [Methylophaga sp.]|tara:strand:- start:2566 stop:3429 length:864 start_codon:yes stop_codon:yes gene_type:complete
MVSKKRGLGRGLDALLGDVSQDENNLNDSLQHFPLDMIQPGKYQPRMDMSQESLEELADSIRSQGLVQPIVVRPIDGGHYEIIAGERRWRASKLAGLESVPVLIKDVSDRNAIAMALIENIQRENLNPMEEANALHRLREEFELTHQQTAEAVGKSRATISNLLRLRNLNDDVKKLLENCDLEMGHARTLLALEGESQSEAALQIVEKGLSVRETEQLIRRLLKPSTADKQEVPQPSLEEIERIEQRIADKLGKGFSIKHRPNGKGKLVFDYSNVDELKRLIKQIGV